MSTSDKTPAGDSSEKNKGTQDTGSGEKPDGKTSTDGDNKDQLKQLEATVAELVQDRNTWKSKARQFEQEKSEKEREATAKSGDVEAIKASFEKELAAANDLNKALTQKLHHEVALGALRRAANGKVVNLGQIERLLGDRITVHEENGQTMPAVKNEKGDGVLYDAGKPMAVEKFLESFLALDENQNLALSTRKGGTGATGASGSVSDDGRIPSIEELEAMPDKGAAWMKANPTKVSKVDISRIKLKG